MYDEPESTFLRIVRIIGVTAGVIIAAFIIVGFVYAAIQPYTN